MINGNGEKSELRKILGLCVGITIAINAPTFFILKQHWSLLGELRSLINVKTVDRYYKSDAVDYSKLVDEKFSSVSFRFSRNESLISACRRTIDKHLDEK